MPRRIKNPERQDPREIINKLIRQIKAIPDTGDELEELRSIHRPEEIFAMPDTRGRDEKIGAYAADLRALLSEAAIRRRLEIKEAQIKKRKASAIQEEEERKAERRAKARAARARRKAKGSTGKKVEAFRPGKKPSSHTVVVSYSGSYQGFRYEVYLLENGKYAVKVTNKARKLLPFSTDKAIEIGTRYLNVKKEIPLDQISRREALEAGTAPVIQEQRFLKKLYREKEDAEVAARRAINTVLNWYDDRGVRTKERMRKTKAARAAVSRRTAGQVKALAMTEAEKAEKKARDKIRKARQERKIEKRFERQQEQRRPSGPTVEGVSRKRVYIPKPNPSTFDALENPDVTAEQRMLTSFKEYKKANKVWKKSIQDGYPDFNAGLKAYDAVENTRANAYIAGRTDLSAKATKARKSLHRRIVELATTFRDMALGDEDRDDDDYEIEDAEFTVRQANPGPKVHQRVGSKKLESAERGLSTYMRTGNATTLMNAYKNFELALEELKYVKDKDGIKRAKKGVKSARAEMSSMMGK